MRDQQLNRVQAERQAIQERQAAEAAHARATISRSGLLLHIQALSALSRESGAVATTIWVVRVWIVLLDAMPVLVRLLQSVVGRRSYDQVLAAFQYGEELEAERLREQAALRLELAREQAQRRAEAAQEKAELEARLVRAYHEHRAKQQFAEFWSTAEPETESGEGEAITGRSRHRGAPGGMEPPEASPPSR
jgi:hypothetical protein